MGYVIDGDHVRPDSVNLGAKPSPWLKTFSEVEGANFEVSETGGKKRQTGNTQHLVRSSGCGAPPHSKRENDAQVSLDGDAGHGEDARHHRRGLHEGNSLADQHACKQSPRRIMSLCA